MTVFEALNYFEYSDINQAVEDTNIKRRYKKLMRKYHPDLTMGDKELEIKYTEISKNINEALTLLLAVIKQIKTIQAIEKAGSKQSIFSIIPFSSLIDLYNNKPITLNSKSVGSDNSSFKLTKSNIRSHNIILNIECEIVVSGIAQAYSVLTPWVLKDEYSINCPILVNNLDTIEVIVKCSGKSVNLSLKSINTRLRLQYGYGIVLYITLEKRMLIE